MIELLSTLKLKNMSVANPNPERANLPQPPRLSQILGPSFILLGLALGSGELVLWPYLAANYGLGLIWGALLGITFQFFLNLEIIRYSLVWGESIFVGFRRLWRWWPIWFIVSTFVPWSLPGFSSAAVTIFCRSFASVSCSPSWQTKATIGLLIFTGLVLTLGKTLYQTMERIQKAAILMGFPLILVFAFGLTQKQDWLDLAWGLVGRGNGWWFFPAGVSLASFLGAFAYSGAGGNLNLAQSYYVKEKGLGMGRYGSKISSILRTKGKKVDLEGRTFALNRQNLTRFRAWWRLVVKEHFLVFWLLGFISIALLSLLAKSLVFGQGSAKGLDFLFQEAAAIKTRLLGLGPVLAAVFLILAALMLYSTQLGVLESSSRIIAENLLLLFWRPGKKVNASAWFYAALWGQILLGVIVLLFGFQEPRLLLTLGAVLNALAMMVLFPLVWYLNRSRLNQKLWPPLWQQLVLALAFVFFLLFSLITLNEAMIK